MSSSLSAGQPGPVTMIIEDRDELLARLRAALGDDVARLPGLGVIGDPAVKVATPDPGQAAADLAARTGRPAYQAERAHLNAVGYGVRLDGYAVEFVGSASGSAHDLVGGFLADHGPGVFATTFRVRDVSAARAALAGAGVRFTQWGRRSLLIRIETGQATADRIELTDED
jgi:hypothetical protein